MSLLLKHTTPLLGIWKMDETETELLAMLGSSAEYAAALREMKAERRRKEWLTSRVLLKALTGDEPHVAYHPDGAPFLPNMPLSISISHTEGYVAILLRHGTAGIDIERRHPRILNVRRRFLSPEEDEAVPCDNAMTYLLICWCAKEAVFKMIRKGNVDFASHIFIEPFTMAAAGDVCAHERQADDGKAYRLRYEVTDEFVLVYST